MKNYESAIDIAFLFFGKPYLWGGNSPVFGLDCSGFICEVLRSIGVIKGDYTAQDLYTHLLSKGARSQLAPGSLLFFGDHKDKITHVAMAINDKLMIEAGGGDRTTNTIIESNKKNAYIRIRPIRSDLVGVLKFEGLLL